MTDAVTSATTSLGQTTSQVDRQALSQDFDQFLSLLTTQLQNQDPLDPMDSSEFTNQLVQFSQVEQQISTNEQLETLVGLQDLSLTSVVLGYIGMNVEVEGEDFSYEGDGQPYQAYYEIPAGGAQVVDITIYDENNQPIYTAKGNNDAGKHELLWDGNDDNGNPVDAGNYRISVQASDSDENPVSVGTVITARIDGVETVDNQLVLTAKDLYIPFSSITAASLPPESASTTQ